MHLEELRTIYVNNGYTLANASAKICQDIILNKIAKSTMNKNVTIKGGVVIHEISHDLRRATRDLDFDFIKYSLDDDSIRNFIDKLNDVSDGIVIKIEDKIEELHHQDYNGKRVSVVLIDQMGFTITTKLDIGVHKDFSLAQEEYCFYLDAIGEDATLMINSKEQMIGEKLKSLLKFGIRSTRYKDIFDFYYLINYTNINKNKLIQVIAELIIKDAFMKENSIEEITRKLGLILNSRVYKNSLNDAKNNWLKIPADEVVENVLIFFESLQVVLA